MSLADLASLASSVAVVVSLLFLGLQIRQSNRNQRSLMQQGRSARNVELLSRLSDPRVSDVISRAANGETLTEQAICLKRGRNPQNVADTVAARLILCHNRDLKDFREP